MSTELPFTSHPHLWCFTTSMRAAPTTHMFHRQHEGSVAVHLHLSVSPSGQQVDDDVIWAWNITKHSIVSATQAEHCQHYRVSVSANCNAVHRATNICQLVYLVLGFEPKQQKSETRMTASVLNKIQTHKRFRRTLFVRTKHNMPIFRVIPFIKPQNNT